MPCPDVFTSPSPPPLPSKCEGLNHETGQRTGGRSTTCAGDTGRSDLGFVVRGVAGGQSRKLHRRLRGADPDNRRASSLARLSTFLKPNEFACQADS